ncbi:MAG: hypothetical protein GJU73_04455 [Ferrovum sp.]|jgi:hypothetical protein|uniref:hypothetical protein n=1 Tax=Ferrovum sp. TaxID=2609467 RepID=UPI00260598C3|nr:hypothetical protein [Ferrovum sp.]MBW8066678.1 hypothetical protein [Ferrovum sp.]
MDIDIETIEYFLEGCEDHGNLSAMFKHRFPGVSLTRCEPSDLFGEIPFRRSRGFDIHLVDGRDHCWKITRELAEATGVVVVEKKR